MGHFGYFGGTENGTSGAQIKILRPLFNTNTPLKPPLVEPCENRNLVNRQHLINLKSLLTDWSGKIKEISRYALGWIVKSTSKLGEGDGCRQPLLGQCSLPRLWEKFKKRNSWKSNLYIKNESTQRLFITHIIWEISWKVYVLVELLKHIKTTCQMWGTIELLRDPIFKSALRELKKVVRTLSYVYVWYTMWFHAKRSSETLKKNKIAYFPL